MTVRDVDLAPAVIVDVVCDVWIRDPAPPGWGPPEPSHVEPVEVLATIDEDTAAVLELAPVRSLPARALAPVLAIVEERARDLAGAP